MQELFKERVIDDFSIKYLVEEIWNRLPQYFYSECNECGHEQTFYFSEIDEEVDLKSDVDRIIRSYLKEKE